MQTSFLFAKKPWMRCSKEQCPMTSFLRSAPSKQLIPRRLHGEQRRLTDEPIHSSPPRKIAASQTSQCTPWHRSLLLFFVVVFQYFFVYYSFFFVRFVSNIFLFFFGPFAHVLHKEAASSHRPEWRRGLPWPSARHGLGYRPFDPTAPPRRWLCESQVHAQAEEGPAGQAAGQAREEGPADEASSSRAEG